MFTIMIVLSLIAAVIGILSLSEATLGVGVIGIAVLLAAFARITQAGATERKVLDRLERLHELSFKTVYGEDAQPPEEKGAAHALGKQMAGFLNRKE